uniref:Uncharacterized protein n=1 Tax=Oryza glumipatula TaxID=40148 RepID=A0A0E0A432_9ORYZ
MEKMPWPATGPSRRWSGPRSDCQFATNSNSIWNVGPTTPVETQAHKSGSNFDPPTAAAAAISARRSGPTRQRDVLIAAGVKGKGDIWWAI